jgi:hypothetical protein
MTVEIITNNLKFNWSEIGETVNIFDLNGENVTACSLCENATLRDFKAYVKRWLKDNDCYNDDGYLLTKISRKYWK